VRCRSLNRNADFYVSKVVAETQRWNMQTAGHKEVEARLRDMDVDGVAAEVIFHGSQNGEVMPFADRITFDAIPDAERRLVAAGQRIYNRWLTDFCSASPERHIGLAQIAIWDLDAASRRSDGRRARA